MEGKEGDKLRIRNSRKMYIPFYFMSVALIAFIIYIKYIGKPLDDLAFKMSLAFVVAVLIAVEIHRLGNSYEINDNSVIHRRGYLTIVSKRLEFGAISDSDIRQNPWQRLLSYGDVEIHLYSKENRTIIKEINNPSKFVDFLQVKMINSGGRRR